MKLVSFSKNKKQKKIIVGSIIGILVIIGSIVLIRSYALYREEKTFNVIRGQVPEFKEGDIQLSIIVNEERVDSIPEKGNYLVDVSCDKGAKGSWDYNHWNVSVSDFVAKTKCDVKFTSVSASEMPDVSSNLKRVTKTSSNIPATPESGDTLLKSIRTETFDFSDIEGYENFTVNNFIANIRSYTAFYHAISTSYPQVRSSIDSISYDQSTGVVSVMYMYNTWEDAATIYHALATIECTVFYN